MEIMRVFIIKKRVKKSNPMNTTCINCDEENAYFNGVCYECPDCDSQWDEDQFDSNDLEDESDNEEFNFLSELEKPFFTLKHGKIYECTVGYTHNDTYLEEQIKLVPLAFKPNYNYFFVIIHIDKMQKEFPNAIKYLSNMDFTTLWNDGFENYFDGSINQPISLVVATTNDTTIISQKDVFFGFKEIH